MAMFPCSLKRLGGPPQYRLNSTLNRLKATLDDLASREPFGDDAEHYGLGIKHEERYKIPISYQAITVHQGTRVFKTQTATGREHFAC